MMDFIKDIHEARMIKGSSDVRTWTYSDCGEKMYLILLTLDLMKHYPRYSVFAHQYARKTKHHTYKGFRHNSTDLYNFLHFLQGDDAALDKLKNPGAAKRAQGMSALPIKEISKYIADLSVGTPSTSQQMFIRIENGLHIDNKEYRDLRRYIGRYPSEPTQAQKNITTKLLYAVRAKLRDSDIIDEFSKLVADKDLETARVDDTEVTFTKPDVGMDMSDLRFYRFLISQSKLPHLQKFLDYMREGKTVPAQFAQAYVPIIEIIDDIVQAGPTYINMLKTVRKNAKKSKNG